MRQLALRRRRRCDGSPGLRLPSSQGAQGPKALEEETQKNILLPKHRDGRDGSGLTASCEALETVSAKLWNDVQCENGSGHGPGPRPAIQYTTDRPLSTSVPGRGVDVVMDCRRRPPESPVGRTPVVRRRRAFLSASQSGHRYPLGLCPDCEAEPWLQEARAQGVRPARCSAGVNLL